jgi:hypothetical protein
MTNNPDQVSSRSSISPVKTIYLEFTKKKSYIKISERCSESDKSGNNGAISIRSKSPVWLSLKQKGASTSYLIGDIAALGGNFTGHPAYQPSAQGRANGLTGVGYAGGVPFQSVGDALAYLAQYFNVVWCDGAESPTVALARSSKPKQNTGSAFNPCDWPKTLSQASVLFSQHASEASPAPDAASFSDFYAKLRSDFLELKRLEMVSGADAHIGKKWPKHPGVYVVRALGNPPSDGFHSSILYVGMTGKLSRVSTSMPGRLSLRPLRLDPYRFSAAGFSYGYNRTTQKYGSHVSAAQIEVDCFVFDGAASAAPAFLEALILQAYALCAADLSSRLPVANNAF